MGTVPARKRASTGEDRDDLVRLPKIGDDKTRLSVPLVRQSKLAEVFGIEDPKQDDEAYRVRQFELLRAELEAKVNAMSRKNHHVVEATSTTSSQALPTPAIPLVDPSPSSVAIFFRHNREHHHHQQMIRQLQQQQRRTSPYFCHVCGEKRTSSGCDHDDNNMNFVADDMNTIVSEDPTNYRRASSSRTSELRRAALAVQQEEMAREAGEMARNEEELWQHPQAPPFPLPGMIVRRLSSI